jgi:hypothetical protein
VAYLGVRLIRSSGNSFGYGPMGKLDAWLVRCLWRVVMLVWHNNDNDIDNGDVRACALAMVCCCTVAEYRPNFYFIVTECENLNILIVSHSSATIRSGNVMRSIDHRSKALLKSNPPANNAASQVII